MTGFETTSLSPNRRVLAAIGRRRDWVDDLEGYLADHGVQLRWVEDGVQSHQLLRDGGFDLAFVDQRLAPISGLSLLRRLHDDRNPTPCVLVAEDRSPKTVRAAFDLRAYSIVAEPVAVQTLSRVVRRIYERRWRLMLGDATS